ncbi:MAG: IS3 family transposase [Bacteroidota bacterium]
MPLSERRDMVDPQEKTLSIVQQCALLRISRSGLYYQPRQTSALNLELMRLIDAHYLEHPYKGAPRMYTYLTKDLGYQISRNRVDRLYYKVMGLRAVFPGPHTSKRAKEHPVYPYLLRGLKIERPNQVWATDITYVPMPKGYMYLVAIIDLFSRYVVNWSLSNSMEAQWCAECFLEALWQCGKPEIINTDQGSQFTSQEFTEAVLGQEVRLSMDGKGRATDNAFIESLWKLVKYEHLYLFAYPSVPELYRGLKYYFDYYNIHRRHSSIGDNFPAMVYGKALKMRKMASYPQSRNAFGGYCNNQNNTSIRGTALGRLDRQINTGART